MVSSRLRQLREKLGSEPTWYCGELHEGLAADPGKIRGKLTAESGWSCWELHTG